MMDEGLPEEVVMERDGKFELLSASDIKAEEEAPAPQQEGEGAGDQSNGTDNISQLQRQERLSEEPAVRGTTESLPTAVQEGASREEEIAEAAETSEKGEESSGGGVATRESDQPPSTPSPSDAAKSEEDETKTGVQGTPKVESQVQIVEPGENETTQPRPDSIQGRTVTVGKVLASASASHMPRQGGKRSRRSRTQSAPGGRATSSKEEEEERARRNEAAFNAWLTQKNREILERQKRERSKQKDLEEEQQRKRKMCDAAFQNWLEVKNKQWQERRVREASLRPVTSVPKNDEERCRQAFQSWMKRKHTQYVEEVRLRQRKRQEMEEVAQRADPSVVERAYKE